MIYTDRQRPCEPNKNWRWTSSSHLHCKPGDEEELHAFARRIGLRREWYQTNSTMPHYDLNEGRFKKAIEAGAVLVSDKELVATLKQWRALIELKR